MHARLSLAMGLFVAALLAGSAGADEAADQYNVASGFFKMNRFEFAAEEYEKFLKSYPKHEQVPEAVYFLAESYYQLDRLDDARKRFREVVSKHAESRNYPFALYRVGETSHLLGDNAAALAALLEFVAKRPDDALLEFALPLVGRVQLNLGKPADALASLRQALEKFPEGRLADQVRFDLAQALDQSSDRDQAMKLYRALAAGAGPFADDAQLAIGSRYFEDKDFELAGQAFQTVERKFPASPWVGPARLNRALCLFQLKQFDDAHAILESQVQGDSKEVPEAWYWLGMTQRARGQFDAAVKTLTESYDRFASSTLAPEMLFYAAQARLEQGQHGAALEGFQRLPDKFPQHELADDAWYYAAESARAAGDHDKAFTIAARFYKEYPASPLTNSMMLAVGQSLIALGRHAEAAAQLATLVRRQPPAGIAAPAQYYRAVALHADGKVSEGLEVLDALAANAAAASADPLVSQVLADAQFLAGTCHFENKDYAKAVGPLRKYLAVRPAGDAVAHAQSYVAISYAALGQFGDLRAALAPLRANQAKSLTIPALFRVAETCFEAKEYVLAAELYGEIAGDGAAGDFHARALAGLGWTRFQEDKFAAASQAFAQLVERYPGDALAAEAAYMRGRSLEAEKKMAEAAVAYEAALVKYSPTTHAFHAGLQRARILHQTGSGPAAAAAYEDLGKRFPESQQLDVVLYEWAWSLQEQGRAAEAKELFDRLARQFPMSALRAEAVINACETLFQSKAYAEVIERLSRLLAQPLAPPAREAALYRLGRTHVELAAWSEAKLQLEQLAEEFPNSRLRREAEFWIAESERQQGATKSAADRLARLVADPSAAEPWLGTAYLRKAQVQGEQKQWKEMLATIEQLKKRFPKYELMHVADYHAGRALQSLARFDEARDSYRRGIAGRSDENAAQCQFMIGEAWFHQKRYQEALREFLKVEILYAFPQWQAAALLEAGKCHESLQEWSRAAETYNRILEKYSKTTHVQEAERRRAAALQKVTAGTSSKK